MARIVNLGVVDPPDFEFRLPDGRAFLVTGAVTMAQKLRFARLEQTLAETRNEFIALPAGEDATEIGERIVSTLEELQDEILALLQEKTPGLEECPFSEEQVGVFLAALNGQLEEIVGPDPTKPSAARARTPKTPSSPNRATRRSRPSSGSPRS